MPRKFVNLTSHSIELVGHESFVATQLYSSLTDEERIINTWSILASFPSAGVAQANLISVVDEMLTVDGHVIEVVKTTYGTVINLPEPSYDTYYIVSTLVAQASKASGRTTDDLLLLSDPIRDIKGRVIGCRRFARL